jgi:hypothetical protein
MGETSSSEREEDPGVLNVDVLDIEVFVLIVKNSLICRPNSINK